jgi:hypothetical protein
MGERETTYAVKCMSPRGFEEWSVTDRVVRDRVAEERMVSVVWDCNAPAAHCPAMISYCVDFPLRSEGEGECEKGTDFLGVEGKE